MSTAIQKNIILKRKKTLVFDEVMADIESNEKLKPKVAVMFMRG